MRSTRAPLVEHEGELAAILTRLGRGDILVLEDLEQLERSLQQLLSGVLQDFLLAVGYGGKSATTAGKLYLAACALRLGATGLTFFDDDVVKFFSPHAQGKSVMFLLAAGQAGRR